MKKVNKISEQVIEIPCNVCPLIIIISLEELQKSSVVTCRNGHEQHFGTSKKIKNKL